MPNAALSEAIKEAYASAPSEQIILHTLELRHPAFVDEAGQTVAIRVVRDTGDLWARLESQAPLQAGERVQFVAMGFELDLPPVDTMPVPEITVIRSTTGVSELVCFGSKAARVDDALIDVLREREAWQFEQPKSLFASGDSVVIADGAFAGLQAVYQMNDAEGRAMVLLDLLSKPVAMKINAANLRKAG